MYEKDNSGVVKYLLIVVWAGMAAAAMAAGDGLNVPRASSEGEGM